MTTIQTYSFALDALPHLRLKNHKGDIRIVADAEPGQVEITLDADRDTDWNAVTTEVDGSDVNVTIPPLLSSESGRGIAIDLGFWSFTAGNAGVRVDVVAHVPEGAGVTVVNGAGDVDLLGTAGDVSAKTGVGDVRLDAGTGIDISTGAGDVRLGRVAGGRASTGSGDVAVASTEGRLTAHTGSGDIAVDEAQGDLEATSGAGDIRVQLTSGAVAAKAGAGDIRIRVPRGVAVWQELTAGIGSVRCDIDQYGAPAEGEPFLTVKAKAGVGDVVLSH